MPSDDGALNDPLDERLAEARDALLENGENVVAQETGDSGQAIVLTDSRVIILKSGLTATGEFNGNRAGVYLLSEIGAVNVRKGPMGAVIQICTDKQEQPAQSGGAPDNVIVFGGAQRAKRCAAIAALIEQALGKPITRTEPGKPTVEKQQIEQANEEPTPIETAPPPAVEQVLEAEAHQDTAEAEDESEEELEESFEFHPNPNLPKPAKRQPGPVPRPLVLLAVLTAVLLIGLAVTSPIRNQGREPDTNVQPAKVARTPAEIREQLAGVETYRSEADSLVRQADEIAAKLDSAARFGNRQAITKALGDDRIEQLWAKASAGTAPAGLAGAKESIVNGLGGLRTTAAALAGSSGSQGSSPDDTALRNIANDRELMRQGLKQIDSMIAGIKTELNGR